MAYAVRIESTVLPGKARAFEAFISGVQELLTEQPGFLRAALLSAHAYPGRYLHLITWEHRAAYRAYVLSEATEAFFAAEPARDLSLPGRPTEASEVLYSVDTGDAAGVHVTGDWTIDPAKAEGFEASRKELLDLRLKYATGFVRGALVRMLSGPGRYVVATTVRSMADLTPAGHLPQTLEMQAFSRAHPASEYGGTAATAYFDIVKVAVAARVRV